MKTCVENCSCHEAGLYCAQVWTNCQRRTCSNTSTEINFEDVDESVDIDMENFLCVTMGEVTDEEETSIV